MLGDSSRFWIFIEVFLSVSKPPHAAEATLLLVLGEVSEIIEEVCLCRILDTTSDVGTGTYIVVFVKSLSSLSSEVVVTFSKLSSSTDCLKFLIVVLKASIPSPTKK